MMTMNIEDNLLRCRICGLIQLTPPWGIDGDTPSFEICPCCSVEFGCEDSTIVAIRQYRSTWISGGAQWMEPDTKPLNWDLQKQLEHIPQEYV